MVYAAKVGVLSLGWLQSRKDAINSIVGVIVLLAGSTIGYLRFFRGRTLTSRLELSISVDTLESPRSGILHSVTVSAKNIGTIAIWGPHPRLHITTWHEDETRQNRVVDGVWQDTAVDHSRKRKVFLIDSGETADFCHEQLFPQCVWAVSYTAAVTSGGTTWAKTKTVENRACSSDT
jgi:hypothetical protein